MVEDDTLAGSNNDQQGKNGRARQVPSKGLLQDFILETLSFESMESREQDVAKAHGNSFGWIFNNSASRRPPANDPKLTEWLSTDDLGSIYWSESSICAIGGHSMGWRLIGGCS